MARRSRSRATVIALAIALGMLIANGNRPRLELRPDRATLLAAAPSAAATVGVRRTIAPPPDLHHAAFVVVPAVALDAPLRDAAPRAWLAPRTSIGSRFLPRSSRGPPRG